MDINASATEAYQGFGVVVATCASICFQSPAVNRTASKRSLAAALDGNSFMIDAQHGSRVVAAEHVGQNRFQVLCMVCLKVLL